MQITFLMKTFGDVIEKSSMEEICDMVQQFVGILYHRGNLESMERYKVVLEAIRNEIDFELKALSSPDMTDPSEYLGAEVGTAYLTRLHKLVSQAIEFSDLEKKS